MASIYSSTVNGWQLRLDYTYTQSVTNNQSTVSLSLYVYNNYSAYNNYSNTAYYTITGTKTYATFSYSSAKEWHLLGTKTQTVNHNADGTGSVSLSANWYSGISNSSYTPASLTISAQTITLTTIARASSLTITNPTASTNYIGTALAMTITPQANTFSHKLYYKMSG